MESTWKHNLAQHELEHGAPDVEQTHYMALTVDNMGSILPVSMVKIKPTSLKLYLYTKIAQARLYIFIFRLTLNLMF